MSKITRYPGLRPFTEQEKHLFFGRSTEVNELLNLLIAEQLVVLFSKSGVGKSSLLYAGLFPKLIEHGYQPVRIRFQPAMSINNAGRQTGRSLLNSIKFALTLFKPDDLSEKKEDEEPHDDNRSPLDIVKSALELSNPNGSQKKDADILYDKKNPGLWEIVKVSEFSEGRIPVLVFDQFEELFYYPVSQQKELLSNLCEIVHSQPPNRILKWLGDIDVEKREEAHILWAQQPTVKIIFAIKDNKLSELESVRKYIPLILKNRFKLLPLSSDNAKEAIRDPAALDKSTYGFDTPVFTFEGSFLETILKKLAGLNNAGASEISLNEEKGIDGSQLQKVCRHIEQEIEKEIKKDKYKGKDIKEISVDKSIIDPEKEIQTIIDNYYSEQLKTLGSYSGIARNIIEKYFVINGTRNFVSAMLMQSLTRGYKGLTEKMLDARLIKEEYIHLGPGYELSHDTLVPAVVKSIREREKTRYQTKTMLISFFILAVIGLSLYGEYQSGVNEARNKREEFEEQSRKAFEKYKHDLAVNSYEEKLKITDYYIDSIKKQKRKVDSLNILLQKQIVELRLSKDSMDMQHLRDSSKIADLQKLKQEQYYELTTTNLNQKIQIDTLTKLVNIFRKSAQKKDPDVKPDEKLKSDLRNSEANLFKAQSKTYVSWFKEGFYLQFDSLRISLIKLNAKDNKIQVRICMAAAEEEDCDRIIEKEEEIKLKKPYIFDEPPYQYQLHLVKIDNAGKNIFTKAAYVKLYREVIR